MRKMITILFTDTHFGVKQNSITWLNSQMKFIDDQLIPYIKSENEPIRLVHLGDVFDSRSTISTLVASKVVEKFKELSGLVDEFIIIGGNHDYYSPNSDQVDTLNLLLSNIKGIRLITKESYIVDNEAFIPWYEWLDQQKVQKMIDDYGLKRVFTHADIVSSKVDVKGVDIYSGHIHIPYIKNHIKNLGSCYYLNFADSNSIRGFYVIRGDKLQMIENDVSIKFYRFYNEDIFKDLTYIKQTDYIEIYVTQSNLSSELYMSKISELSKIHKNIWIIPQTSIVESSNISFDGYDMVSVINELIPDDLKDKFQLILNKINMDV